MLYMSKVVLGTVTLAPQSLPPAVGLVLGTLLVLHLLVRTLIRGIPLLAIFLPQNLAARAERVLSILYDQPTAQQRSTATEDDATDP
jgi:hypothetical protein